MKYFVLFKKEQDGGYTALIPSLPGCISYGDTIEQASEHIQEAAQGYLAVQQELEEDYTDDTYSFMDSLTIPLTNFTLSRKKYASVA